MSGTASWPPCATSCRPDRRRRGRAVHREPGVHLDAEPRAAFRDGRLLDLSRLEYDLLLFLAQHPRQIFSRAQLLARVWGHVHTGARTVDVHISRLRHKLGEPELISTVYGVGYRLADAAPVRVVPPRGGGVSWTA
jgi:DNA-binding response OmpR family regulator